MHTTVTIDKKRTTQLYKTEIYTPKRSVGARERSKAWERVMYEFPSRAWELEKLIYEFPSKTWELE
ncbi:MAG: hypothetical protein L3J19_05995 [Sulfurimonas sp.]|nr:hypothetical protein [Sulfurimonas sp.]